MLHALYDVRALFILYQATDYIPIYVVPPLTHWSVALPLYVLTSY